MKKLLLTLTVVLISFVTINAQEDHFHFQGIPIDGSVDSVRAALEQKGFQYKDSADDIVTMEGEFTGKKCEIALLVTPKSKTVWRIAVSTPEYFSWHDIRYDFNNLKRIYIKKYGNPEKDYHFFSEPYDEGDGYEMTGLKNDKCHYATYFETESGSIMIQMTRFAKILILYDDNKNTIIHTTEKEEKALDDI